VLLLLFRFLPYVSIWIAMFFLYVFIPNTRIRFASAAVGAVFAGTAWQLVQWGYFHFQVGVANYNAIYGALAAVPIFLVWIYVSWIIVLFGLEIVFAHQHRSHGLLGFGAYSLTVAAYEELALALLIQVNMKFKAGGTPPSAHCLADELNLPLLQVEIVVNKLEQLGLLVAVTGKEPGWLPGRDSAEVLISDVLSLLRGDSLLKSEPPSLYVAQEVVRQGWSSSVLTLEKLTVRDLQMKLAIISCTNEDAGNA
jgi:membrane protein